MAECSRNPVGDTRLPGTKLERYEEEPCPWRPGEDICTAARAVPPPLPAAATLTANTSKRAESIPPVSPTPQRGEQVPSLARRANPCARKPPLVAWAPVGLAVLLAVFLLGGLVLLIRRTPADADPEAAPTVSQASGQPRPDLPLAGPPAKGEPTPPALPAPPPVAPPAPPGITDPPLAGPAAPAPAAPAPAPDENPPKVGQSEPAAPACAVDHRFGTSVNFVDSPTEAAEKALKDKKLLFVLHVAGNFEKDCFT
jgi:hypothetical protein